MATTLEERVMELAKRVTQLESENKKREDAFDREMRGGFEQLHGRLDRLHTTVTHIDFELSLAVNKLDAMDERSVRIEDLLKKRFNGGSHE